MQRFTVFLTLLLTLTACIPITIESTDVNEHKINVPVLKGTFETSLLASEWRGSSAENVLFLLDPRNGMPLPEYPEISLGHTFFHTISPDRQTLAVVSFSNSSVYNGNLLFIDLKNWETRTFELGLSGWVSTMVFRPDGRQLAIAHGETNYKLTTVNIEKGKIEAQIPTEFIVTRLKYTENGDALMLYSPTIDSAGNGLAGPPEVHLLNAIDLTPRWSAKLKDIHDGIFPKDETVTSANLYELGQAFYFSPGMAFAPARDTLYIVHADSAKLTTVDFENQKVETVEIQAKLTWLEKFLSLGVKVAHAKIGDGVSRQAAVSPDGKFLYVVGVNNASFQDQNGSWQFEQTPSGLEILNTQDGNRVDHVETDATELSLSPDGQFLYLKNWGNDQNNMPGTEIFDTSSRQVVMHKTGIAATPAWLMNGEFLLVSTYSTSETSHHMSVMGLDGSPVLEEWMDTQYIWWMTTP